MTRDMELIRTLLFRLEALSSAHSIYLIGGHDEELAVDGKTPDEVEYHLALMKEAGLIECPGSGSMDGRISFRRLTWQGHDFIETVRDPTIWEETKTTAKKAGVSTIEFFWGIAKEVAKAEIKKHTGFDLQ